MDGFTGNACTPSGWFWSRYGIDTPARGYDKSRTFFRTEDDYPGPQTMKDAERFLREASPHHDRWFLFVDEFDPHEPFDTPPPWSGMYFDEPWMMNGLSGHHILMEAFLVE